MTTSQPTAVRHTRRPGDAPARDPMQEFANRIITELENGVKPWVRPWDPEKAGGPQAPFNPVTGKRYHGINVLILGMDMRVFQTGDPRWMTYQQAQGKDLSLIHIYGQWPVRPPDTMPFQNRSKERGPCEVPMSQHQDAGMDEVQEVVFSLASKPL